MRLPFVLPLLSALALSSPRALTAQTASMRVSLPSPTAAALGKFGDVPVSLYTGVPEIAIPLFTAKGRTLELPIALRYHASGIRVEEVAGWAGLGWTLEAGGAITRTVRGLVDETTNGYYWTGYNWWLSGNWPTPPGTLLDNVINEQVDGEPDQFVFSFAGRSGQFVMGPTSASPSVKEVRTIPYQKLRIEPTGVGGMITSWVITSEDGTRYTFAAAETNTDYNVTNPGGQIPAHYGDSYVTSWQLTGIRASGGDSISLFYTPYTATHRLKTYREKFDQVQNTPPAACVSGYFEVINNYGVTTQRLDSIKTATHTVRFTVGVTLRTDALSMTGAMQEPRLDRITVTTPTGTELRRFQLEHDYSSSGRLTLKAVSEQDRNAVSLPPHSFTYDATALPADTSNAQDHWGYFNGKTSNTTLIPPGITPSGASLPGADRSPDLPSMRAGALTRITYPTGGSSEFVYGANDYGGVGVADAPPAGAGPPLTAIAYADMYEGSITTPFTVGGSATITATVSVYLDPACGPQFGCPYAEIIGVASWIAPGTYTVSLPPGNYTLHAAEEFSGGFSLVRVDWQDWIVLPKKPAGGLRIAELRTVDGMGLTTIRKYRYLLQSDTTRSSGVVNAEPDYDYYVSTAGCSYYSRSTTSKTPLGGGAPVNYREVTVWAGASGEFGRTRHTFLSSLLYPDLPISQAQWPGAKRMSREWQRGHLTGTTVMNAAGAVQQRTAATWAFHETPPFYPVEARRFLAMGVNSFSGGFGSLTAYNDYEVVSGWVLAVSDTTVAFDEAGVSAVTTSRAYIYANPEHAQLTTLVETASGGARRVTRYTYPADYATGSGDPEAVALTAMKGTAHLHNAVIERSVHDSLGSLRTAQAELTTYRTTAGNQLLPYQTFVLDVPSPDSTFVASAVAGGVLTKDSRYVVQETANSYDAFGRILQLTDPRGKVTTYLYGGNPNAAFLTRVTRVKDAAGVVDLVTDLTWNSDGFLIKLTDEGGSRQHFAYDLYGRLTQRRNDDSTLVAQHAYAYSRTSANGWTFSATSPNVVTTTTFLQQTPTPKSVSAQEFLDGLGRPVQTVVQGGTTYFVSGTQYDVMGRVWRTWKPYSRTTAGFDPAFTTNAISAYNAYHSVSNAKPYAETQYTADGLARVKLETPPFLGTTATAYRQFAFGVDAGQFQQYTETTDEVGKKTRAFTDVLGNAAKSVLGYGAAEATTTTLAHDVLGRRIQSTDPRNVITTPVYSTRGLVTSTANADAGNITREYDRAGNLRYAQDANQATAGQVLFTTYDFAGRPLLTGLGAGALASLDPDAASPPALETTQANWLTVNAYDAKPSTAVFPWSLFSAEIAPLTLLRVNGRRVAEASRSNGAWQVTLLSYDVEGRVQNRYQCTQNNAATAVLSALNTVATYTYDLRGALTQRSLTVGSTAFYQWSDYDDRGLLWKGFAATTGTKPGSPDVTFTYRPSGEPDTSVFAGGPSVPFRYTIREQLEKLGDPATTTYPFSARYAYHANGTVSESEFYQSGTPATAKRYRYVISAANYDALNRLKAADFSSWNGSSWPVTPAYDLANITYDGAGNLARLQRYRSAATLVDQLAYSYPGTSNRLSSVTDGIAPTAETWDAESGSFTYDPNGNLLTAPAPYSLTAATYDPWNRLKSVTKGGVTTNYRATASGHRLAQWTGSGPTEVTLREGSTVLGGVTLDAAGTPTAWHFNLLAGAQVVGRQPNTGSRRYYHMDLLGSVRAVVTGTTVVESTDYDPWGVVLAGRSLSSGTKEGFTGQPRDAVTGMDDFGARAYLPALGRWGGADPAAAAMSEWSPYTYVLDNPSSDADADGQIPWSKAVKLAKAVVQGGDIASTFADNIQQVKTLADPEASAGAKAWAGVQLGISILSPVDVSDVKGVGRMLARVVDKVDDASDAARATGTATRLGSDAAQVTINRAQGIAGEAVTEAALRESGEFAGKQVTFVTSKGTRTRIDFVTNTKTGKSVVDTKTGRAKLTRGQQELFDDVKEGREVTPVGARAREAGLEPGRPVKLEGPPRVDRPDRPPPPDQQ